MFIRKTKTGTAKDGTARYSVRLVQNERVNGQVKQRTLLNLGRHFSIDKQYWGLLCQRVEELLSAQDRFDFIAPQPNIESEARRIAACLVDRASESVPEEQTTKDFQSVDVNSGADGDVRTVGVEHAALAALETLEVPQLLQNLGFNRRQRCLALATIVARMAAPASERETNRWLRKTTALGEMLGIDFGALSEMALYRVSDQLLAHHSEIEQYLFKRACTLFSLQPTIAFYDLTNTYLEGQALGMPAAKHGRSKEKRSDCPLLTLAVVVDASGFVVKSRIFAGNVAECKTLAEMLDESGADQGAVVVMDRGVADTDNLKWLKEHGYRYVVVSREQRREFEAEAVETIDTACGQGKRHDHTVHETL